jgi:hypothetical protein
VENDWIAHAAVYCFDDSRRLAPAVYECSAVLDVQGGAFKYKRAFYQKFQYRRTGFAVAASLDFLLHFCRLETIPNGES